MEVIKKIRVLVIEDNSSDADFLMGAIERCRDVTIYGAYELEAQWVRSLQDAQDRLEEFDFDLIFQNLHLDGTKSKSALREVKAISKNIPIVVTTGHLNRTLWQEAFLEGAQDFILKESINSQVIIKTIFHTFERLKYQAAHLGTVSS